MKKHPTFSVVITGEIRDGFEAAATTGKFAALFKLSPDKASSLLAKRRVVKKEVDAATAEKYRKKLESIGLVVELEEHEVPEDSFGGLALEPIEESRPPAPEGEEPAQATPVCPKCGAAHVPAAKLCESCGFQLGQMATAAATASSMAPPGGASATVKAGSAAHSREEPSSPLIETGAVLAPMAVGAAIGAAFLGALLWKVIAMTTGYEVGFVAWGIGGAIGIAASVMGGRGAVSGVVCAGLALMANLGGKYMVVSEMMDQMTGELQSAEMQAEWQAVYEEDLMDASIYAEQVYDRETLKSFMVERGYSMAYDAQEVSDEEVRFFQQESEPHLKSIAYGEPPTFDEWYRDNVAAGVGDVSKAGIVSESLGLVDVIFLLLGVGTAFRLGQGVNFN